MCGAARQHAVVGHQTGHTHPDHVGRPDRLEQIAEAVDQLLGLVRGRAPLGCHDNAFVVQTNGEALRAADIDADPGHHPGDASGLVATGPYASARAFSSLTVLRIRTSARRLMKPGRGTTSSIDRS